MRGENIDQELGPRRFIEDSKWPRYIQALGAIVSGSTASLILVYRQILLKFDPHDAGLLFTGGVALFAVAAGVVIALSQRAVVLYDRGLTVGELRLAELFKRDVPIPYEVVDRVALVQKRGEWIIKAKTKGGRRILIIGSHFAEPKAVLDFLGSRLHLDTVA